MLDFKMNKEEVLSLVFFILVILFGFWSLIALTPLIFVILVKLFKNSETTYRITLLDIAFVSIAVSELLAVCFSAYTGNGETNSFKLFIVLFLYLAYKGYFKSERKKTLFSLALFILTTVLALFTVIFFGLHYVNVLDNGFAELNNFKNLYNPFGVWNNLWACILLLLLPFTLIFLLRLQKQKIRLWGLLTLLLLVFGVVISFSRGIYLSLICFIVVFNLLMFGQLKPKRLLIVNGLALGMLMVSVLIVKDSVLTTMAFNKTVSQQRSTSGRIDRWEHALQLVKERPIIGWGNGNFILARDTSPFMAEDAVFSSKTDNTYLQILIEKGVLGFLAYFLLFAICTCIVFKGLKNKTNTKKQKLELVLIFSGLMAFLVRELTFSSLFVNNSVYFLAFHLVFFLIPYDVGLKSIRIPKAIKYGSAILGSGAVIFLLYNHVEHAVLNNQNNQFVKAFNKGERAEAGELMEKILKKDSDNIVLNKHKALLLSQNTLQISLSHKHPELLKFENTQKDTLELVKKHLRKIVSLHPYDDETYHNLGWVHFALNRKDSSEICFKKALELRPYNSSYRVSKILFDYSSGHDENITADLTKVLRYSPDILESPFYKEFSKKRPKVASIAQKEAIKGLFLTLENGDNPILKARLARLLLWEKPVKSYELLKEITASLPNLYRPWAYLAYAEEDKDAVQAGKYYEKAVFLSNGDFLPKLYYARFNKRLGNDKKGVKFYKEALQAYGALTSDGFYKNRAIADLRTIRNSYIPNDLLYYVSPDIHSQEIFDYLIDYYRNTGDTQTMEFYQDLSKKYKNRVYKGNEVLR